jgi:hypothetical protein
VQFPPRHRPGFTARKAPRTSRPRREGGVTRASTGVRDDRNVIGNLEWRAVPEIGCRAGRLAARQREQEFILRDGGCPEP